MKLSTALTLPKESIVLAIKTQLRQYGYKLHTKKDRYIYAKGKLPILLNAHFDVVHETRLRKEIYFHKDKQVYYSPQGLGADDRAGVFAIFRLLRMGYRPHVLFTDLEENGGKGAKSFAKSKQLKTVAKNCHFLIGLDRRGDKNAVYYDCGNTKFKEYIESFDFDRKVGSYSDVSTLGPETKLASVNLSVGYQSEHTTAEVLFVKHLFNTIHRVKEILETKSKKFEDETKKWGTYNNNYNRRDIDWDLDESLYGCCGNYGNRNKDPLLKARNMIDLSERQKIHRNNINQQKALSVVGGKIPDISKKKTPIPKELQGLIYPNRWNESPFAYIAALGNLLGVTADRELKRKFGRKIISTSITKEQQEQLALYFLDMAYCVYG